MTVRIPLAAIAALALAAPPAAAQYTWTGPSNSVWSTPANWTPSGPPNGAAATATFNNSFGTLSVDTPITVGAVTFNNTSTTSNLALSGGGALTLDNGAGANSSLTTGPTATGVTVSANLTVGGNGVLDLVMQNPAGTGGLVLSGLITASGGTVVAKQGLVVLSGANTYGSATQIDTGALLRLNAATNLSANSNLVFNGGQLGLPSGTTFTRNVGTGAGEVRFAGSGGFVATSGSVTVRLNNGASSVQTWGAGNFLPDGASLLLGLATATSGTVIFQNALDLNGGVRTVSAALNSPTAMHTLGGAITDSVGGGGLTKTGNGILQLTGTNSYAGPTRVAGGVLAAVQGTRLPNASNLTLDGGIYSPTTGGSGPILFNRQLGPGGGQVQWGPNGGGFASGNDLLTIKLNDNTNTLAWGGAPGFVLAGSPLMFTLFGSNPAVSGPSIDFQNGIDLNGDNRTIHTDRSFVVRISGPVVNNAGSPAGLTKTGTAVLELTGTNSYNGPTAVNGGVLRTAVGTGLPAAGNLSLDGGVYEAIGSGTFNRQIGPAPGQVQWGPNGGGLSAYNGTLTVQLNNTTNAVAWGSPNFIPAGQPLTVGAYTDPEGPAAGSPGVLDFRNGINLNGANRTINVPFLPPSSNGTAVGGLVRFAGPISGTGAGVTVSGSGLNQAPVVEFAGANTYTGPTVLTGPTLRANPGQGLPNASNLDINGGRLELTGPATFSRGLGTGANQVQLRNGGLGAYNGAVAVQLNGGAGLTWGSSANFLQTSGTLTLTVRAGEGFAGQTVLDFQNDLNLNGTSRTIEVLDHTTTKGNLARISGAITSSGAAGLTVMSSGSTATQNSTLELAGTNTYTGPTVVNLATLRAVDGGGLPGGSNLTLNNGVYESPGTATFERQLGTTAGRVQWTSHGGFAAGSGTLTVRLNGGTGTMVFGTTPSFVPGSGKLIFGSRTAAGAVDFQNGLDLNSGLGDRTIEVRGGTTARLSGVVSNGDLNLLGFNGGGVLELTAANTYAGGTSVAGATSGPVSRTTLMVLNTTGSGTGSGAVGVGVDGVLGGTGSITGAVTVTTGTIQAGNANGVGTLTIGGGLTLTNATLAVRLTDGSVPSSTLGGSTVGGTPNPSSNNFFNILAGSFSFDPNSRVVIDGTGTAFQPGQQYSYQVGQRDLQNLSSLNVTDQARFTAVGFSAFDFALRGDADGNVYVNFTTAPVPEPGLVLLCAAVGLGVARRLRGRRLGVGRGL